MQVGCESVSSHLADFHDLTDGWKPCEQVAEDSRNQRRVSTTKI